MSKKYSGTESRRQLNLITYLSVALINGGLVGHEKVQRWVKNDGNLKTDQSLFTALKATSAKKLIPNKQGVNFNTKI